MSNQKKIFFFMFMSLAFSQMLYCRVTQISASEKAQTKQANTP